MGITDIKNFFFKENERVFRHYKKCENGNYVIEISVPKLEKFFSPYDPTPLNQKDIDPTIMNMILSQIVVFPTHLNVELHVHLPKNIERKKLEPSIENAIRHHFEYELLDSDLHLQRRVHKGLKTFMYAGIVFTALFTVSFLLNKFYGDHVILHLLAEGFAIGAWVSLWHPIEMLLYEWLPLYENKKKYQRLRSIPIKFKYI